MIYSRAVTLGADADHKQQLVWLAAAGRAWLNRSYQEALLQFASAVEDTHRSGTLQALVSSEIERLGDDISYTPDRVVPGRVALYEDRECRLDLCALPAGDAETTTLLYSDASSVIYVVLDREAEILVSSYDAPTVERNDVFMPGARLDQLECRRVESFHTVRANSERLTAHEYRSDRPTVLARISLKKALPFVWGFERATLEAKLLYPSDVSASRTSLAMDFLKVSDHPRLPELCTNLLDSPWHFLRWKAIQFMAELDTESLDSLLARAIDDEHLDIRTTASRVLAGRT
ncbi:hypothetical protein [Dokdonella soli]|uniref:HEAT repeat domain-containing protein n=1 Tax=Dokdonella soli TaxID=529810 RepID=A0ABN1IFW0_9GAMM